MFQQILESIKQFGSFSKEEQNVLIAHLEIRALKKNEFVLKTGAVSQHIYFVNKGSLRHFKSLDGYTEHTKNLFLENDWVLDRSSFTSQKPSEYCIQACEDCELLSLHMKKAHELIAKSPSFFRLGKVLEESNEYENLNSPQEKYLKLMNDCPEIIQRFPLKHIASYLGMTPETLSRVRAKVKL